MPDAAKMVAALAVGVAVPSVVALLFVGTGLVSLEPFLAIPWARLFAVISAALVFLARSYQFLRATQTQ